MSSRSGLYPREAVHRLASPQTSFGARSSRIHFSPTDGLSYERVAQFNLKWTFSKLDSGFQSLVGFRILSAGFRIPQAKNSCIPESGFPYKGWSVNGQFTTRSSSFHSYSATSCEDDNVKVKEKSVCVMLLKDVGVFLFYFFTFKSFSGSTFDM